MDNRDMDSANTLTTSFCAEEAFTSSLGRRIRRGGSVHSGALSGARQWLMGYRLGKRRPHHTLSSTLHSVALAEYCETMLARGTVCRSTDPLFPEDIVPSMRHLAGYSTEVARSLSVTAQANTGRTEKVTSDPLLSRSTTAPDGSNTSSYVAHCTIALKRFFQDEAAFASFCQGERTARTSLADFVARHFIEQREKATLEIDGQKISLEPLDRAFLRTKRRRKNLSAPYHPYVLERSDFWCSESELNISVRMVVENMAANGDVNLIEEKKTEESVLESTCGMILKKIINVGEPEFSEKIMKHVACTVLQHKIRLHLASSKNVAFIADGSILPRKSGTSDAPMASPPAIPFKAPAESPMSQSISIEMDSLVKFLPQSLVDEGFSSVTMSGLVVPPGITLICGGGYHGKSTMLRTIALGIYNKIYGDGREFCVSVSDAVSVRAEDGRYVNNCNISAFISNLPTPPGVTKTVDTEHFSSRDSSGSTSQAANVSEAIEMGASALLIDEDVSAANFMARDGRMRALVMDESITPLLYRVNGLYKTHGISSVVVVGGVGDWLDVPHNVILLDKYVASDATKKARSISYQFSYGHVQYGGKGVVHRLEWEKKGTPTPRRPKDFFTRSSTSDIVVSLLDGGHAISLHEENTEGDDMAIDGDDEEGCIEASRMEQVMGRRQLYGCGLCVCWILQAAKEKKELGLPDLLAELDSVLDSGGMTRVLSDISNGEIFSKSWKHVVEAVGFVERPRRFEIGQALTRLHGIQMEQIPLEDDESDAAAQMEEARKKKALAEIWASRRKK
eukprot:scaffold2186_cov113-Cylindrotheca_fusiformis.AAC.4